METSGTAENGQETVALSTPVTSKVVVPVQDVLMRGPPVRNQRRARTMFTESAVSFLEAQFSLNPYPNAELREHIAISLGVQEARVHTWFQNKRSRAKRDIRQSESSHPPEKRSGAPTHDNVQHSSAETSSSKESKHAVVPLAAVPPSSSLNIRRPWEDKTVKTTPSPEHRRSGPPVASTSTAAGANESPDSGVLDMIRRDSDELPRPPLLDHSPRNMGPFDYLPYSPILPVHPSSNASSIYFFMPPFVHSAGSPFSPLRPPAAHRSSSLASPFLPSRQMRKDN